MNEGCTQYNNGLFNVIAILWKFVRVRLQEDVDDDCNDDDDDDEDDDDNECDGANAPKTLMAPAEKKCIFGLK